MMKLKYGLIRNEHKNNNYYCVQIPHIPNGASLVGQLRDSIIIIIILLFNFVFTIKHILLLLLFHKFQSVYCMSLKSRH